MVRVLGVDILPGSSPGSAAQPHYAAVLLEDGRVVSRFADVSLDELIRIAWEIEPDMLAIDNVFELAESPSELARLARRLPPRTQLIQVTLVDGKRAYPLPVLARLRGLNVGSKLSPLEAAEVAARLAYRGVGSVLRLFEEKTKIVVARAKMPKAGGMSRDRYLRHVSTAVLRVTRQIREALDKHGFDYDCFYRRGSGGLEGSLFIVYAPRERLYGVVKPIRRNDVVVKVKAVERHIFAFEPLNAARREPAPSRYLIVGIDPGIVTGLALLDIDGRPVLILSKRYLSRGDIVSIINEHGVPVLLATDVPKPPAMVRKLASMLHVPLYAPSVPLTVAEKERLVGEFLEKHRRLSPALEVVDSHQRDALAAAIKAYKAYKPKFEQAEAKVRELGAEVSLRDVKAWIVRGLSVAEAIARALRKLEEQQAPVELDLSSAKRTIESLRAQVRRQAETILKLTEERDLLLNKLGELRSKVRELEEQLERLREEESKRLREHTIVMRLSRRIEELETRLASACDRIEKLESELRDARRALMKVASGELLPVKHMRALTHDSLRECDALWGLKRGDLVLVSDVASATEDAIRELQARGVRALLVLQEPPAHVREWLETYAIPWVVLGERDIVWALGVPLLREPRRLLASVRKRAAEVARKSRMKNLAMLKRIIEDYRAQRARELEQL